MPFARQCSAVPRRGVGGEGDHRWRRADLGLLPVVPDVGHGRKPVPHRHLAVHQDQPVVRLVLDPGEGLAAAAGDLDLAAQLPGHGGAHLLVHHVVVDEQQLAVETDPRAGPWSAPRARAWPCQRCGAGPQ